MAELLAQYMLDHKYNYSFLKASHNKVRLCNPEVIVTGSSHALNGIKEDVFSEGCANLSMHSQDIYYDMANAKHAIQNSGGTIKTCIIVLGYYMIGQDLSKSEKWGHRLIREIYFPLFHDSYHWDNPECGEVWGVFESDLNDPDAIKKETEGILNKILWKGYYNEYKERKSGIFDWSGRTWKDLTADEREMAAKQRTDSHNKFLKRSETIAENYGVLTQFIHCLHMNQIRPIVVVMPFTKEYMKYTNPEYAGMVADMVHNAAREAACPVAFYDLNRYDFWTEEDFIDTDHMSISGAEKVSIFLKEQIE